MRTPRPGGVLILKWGALGDLLIATPIIRQIQLHEGPATILTAPIYAPIFEGWPDLAVHAVERRGVGALCRTLVDFRRKRYARLYDLQCNDRSRFLCLLSGIHERVGNTPSRAYTHAPPPPTGDKPHPFGSLNAMLRAAGVPEAAPTPWLPITDQERVAVSDWCRTRGLRDRDFALFHAGGSGRWESKRWPYYESLAKAVERRGVRVVWIGAGTDRALNRSLARAIGIDATGAFSVCALAELGRRARFALTNDSGPMHVLAVSGIPVYAFFGPTSVARSHALGQEHRALVHPVPCSPCGLAVCPVERAHACLRRLAAEAVMERLIEDGLL